MKLKFLILSLFIGFFVQAQTPLPGSTLVNARYQWLGGKFQQLKIPMYADTTQYPLWLPRVGGDMMLDTAGADQGVIYVRYNQYWHGVSGNGGSSDTSGYKYFAAQYPLILVGGGDTAYLSIDTAGLSGGGGAGAVDLSDLPTKGRITLADYSSLTTSPRLWYEGFNSNTVIGDTVYTTFARKFNHVDPGWNPLVRSVDGGMTWDSINVLAKPGNAVAIGSANDTLFYSYEKAPFSSKQYFGYSVNFGRTLVLSDSISDPGYATCTFGRMIKLPSGKKIWPFYHLNTVSNWKIGLYESIDGVHWTIGSIVDQQTSGTPHLNEAWVEWINPEVTTDAQVKLMYIARDELAKGHIQYNSSNGGATWTRIGRINALYSVEDEYGFPADLTLYGGKLYLIAGRRVTIPGGSTLPDRHVSVIMTDPAKAFTDTNAWSKPNRIYNAEADYRTDDVFNNFGYFFSYVLKGEMRVIGYDQDPRTVYGDSVKTRMLSMPVFGIGMTEAYNTVNQNVTANTETLVSTPLEWYNSDLFHSTTTDTMAVTTDGFYHFDASLTLTPELDGSYSKVYIKVIDPGDPVGTRIVAADVLYPTLDQDSYRVRISGTEFIRAFEKVVFCIYSDAARTIRNQLSKDDRARIKMKKL